MPFKLPRLQRQIKITDKDFPTQAFHYWIQLFAETIETQETSQDDLLAAIQAVQADILAAQADIAAAQADIAVAQADIVAVAADVAAIEVPPSGTRTVTVSDTITDTDATILADATGGAIVLSLPPAATITTAIRVQKVDASANTVTIDAAGTDSINGNPSLVLATQYEDVNLNSDGIADWYAS